MRSARAIRTVGVGAACVALMLGPLPLAAAEGPGYGGTAGELAVSWESTAATATLPSPETTPAQAPSSNQPSTPDAPATPEQPIAPVDPLLPADEPQAMSFGGGVRGISMSVALPPARDPQLNTSGLDLVVRGLGFRGKSAVEVRVGSGEPVLTRADTAGSLTVALDPKELTGAKPGVSVMAVGRNQSGTEVTLFGSIPPVADGSGPMTLVPWVVGSVAVAGLVLWMRRRHALHTAEAPEVPA